jgi:phage terminase small subunit
MAKLTAKQELFCLEYLIDLNATQAAIRAGYSEKTAKDIACENLAKPNLQSRIAELKAERVERTEINADWVLKQQQEVYKVAMGIIPTKVVVRESVGDGMTQHLTQEMMKHDLAAANKALETIGKHIDVQAWNDKKEITGSLQVSKPKAEIEAELISLGIDPSTL